MTVPGSGAVAPGASAASDSFSGRRPFLYLILGHYYVRPMTAMSQIGHAYSGGEQQSIADRFSAIGGNAIVYTYPSGDVDILCAAERVFVPPGWEASEDFARQGRKGPAPAKREKGIKSEGDDMLRSMRRARAKLRRLALSNEFDFFVTLTLDKDRIDRYDPKAIMQRVNRWLDNMVRRNGLRYALVPEQHKDGAYHFHGFFAGEGLEAVDSGTISLPSESKPRRPADEAQRAEWLGAGGHVVYNLPQWDLGFTTALRLYGTYGAAVGYVTKYIGKQQGQRPMGRWYYSGGALKDAPKEYATLDYRQLVQDFAGEVVEFDIPGTKMLVIHHRQ